MVKDKELLTLREDNRLLAKQFREKKEAQKKREQFSQVISNWSKTLHCGIMYFTGANNKARTAWEWSVWNRK